MDPKLFNLLVARTQTRETSTLAVTIIATSASLILLGFVCQVNGDPRYLLAAAGIGYPILGMIFFEFTYRTIQKHDWDLIRTNFTDKELEIVRPGFNNFWRRFIFYLLFALLPIGIWCYVFTNEIC